MDRPKGEFELNEKSNRREKRKQIKYTCLRGYISRLSVNKIYYGVRGEKVQGKKNTRRRSIKCQ